MPIKGMSKNIWNEECTEKLKEMYSKIEELNSFYNSLPDQLKEGIDEGFEYEYKLSLLMCRLPVTMHDIMTEYGIDAE